MPTVRHPSLLRRDPGASCPFSGFRRAAIREGAAGRRSIESRRRLSMIRGIAGDRGRLASGICPGIGYDGMIAVALVD